MIGLGILRTMFGFWGSLPPTIKNIILAILIGLAGFMYGQNVSNRKCEARAQASIVEARRIDTEANETRFNTMEADKEKYRIESLNNENKLVEAAAEYQTLKEACKPDEDFVKRNNDIGRELDGKRLPDKVPSHKPRPTPNK